MANKIDHVLVFTTSKSMHERFSTPKQQRSVFVLNDVDSVPCENDDGGGTLPDKQMETNEMQSPLNECNIGENQQIPKNQQRQLARGSQKSMIANTLGNGAEYEGDKMLSANFRPRRFNSNAPRPGLRYGKYNSIGKRFNGRNRGWKQANNCSQYNVFGKCYYNWSIPRKWKRKFVSKDQLDDEIDKYMAEVDPLPSSVTKDEYEVGFTEQYLNEAEQFLKKYEDVG